MANCSVRRLACVFTAGLYLLTFLIYFNGGGRTRQFRQSLYAHFQPQIDHAALSHANPTSSLTPPTDQIHASDRTDWHRFAYVQYVTDVHYLCNSLMLFAKLSELGCKADHLMMYPEEWKEDGESQENGLIRLAESSYNVKLQPVQIQAKAQADPTWSKSYTKLLAMNQTQYYRVLSLDSDSTVLACLDELFLMPPAPVAMPQAYWLLPDSPILSSQVLLLETSAEEFARLEGEIQKADTRTFDMDILDELYHDSAVILPHRKYDLLTGEFKTRHGEVRNHVNFLGSELEEWNAPEALAEAKFLHFSDWPLPKPWLPISQGELDSRGPQCVSDNDCEDHDIWYQIYGDFKRRRKNVCGISTRGDVKDASLPRRNLGS